MREEFGGCQSVGDGTMVVHSPTEVRPAGRCCSQFAEHGIGGGALLWEEEGGTLVWVEEGGVMG